MKISSILYGVLKGHQNQKVNYFTEKEKTHFIKNDNKQNEQDKMILTSGRYVGGIDIPCGIYKANYISGNGMLDVKSQNGEEPKWQVITFDVSENTSYNGVFIRENSILEVDRLKVEFLFIREIDKNNQRQNRLEGQDEVENKENVQILDLDYDLMDGWQFEEFCASVLRNNGYQDVSVTSGSGDYGADIIGYKHNMKYVIQCKNYNGKIGNKAVQEIFSAKAYYKADFAVVMTNNYFTDHAIEHAKGTNVILWDRDILNEMIGEMKIKNGNEYNIIEKNESEEVEKVLYDREKGIYPAGRYIVGEDIEIGTYILIGKPNEEAEVQLLKNESGEEEILDEYFKGAYHITLKKKGSLLIVSDAHIEKV